MRCLSTFLFAVLTVSLISSCQTKQEPLRYGVDACDYCKMLLMDQSFGGEIITGKGKIFKFDDTSCMITFLNNTLSSQGEVSKIHVIDFGNPSTLIEAKQAKFVQDEDIKSPMASGIAAFSS